MDNEIKLVCKETREKPGNDCYIYDAYTIVKWQGEYLFSHLRKYAGAWSKNEISCEEARSFDDEHQAIAYMKQVIKENY